MSEAPRRPRALVLMVKVPYPGTCKTRLCPPLTPREAASLYRCFLQDLAREVPSWDLDADLVLAWADDDRRDGADDSEILPPPLASIFEDTPFEPMRQRGASLTARMDAVFSELASRGYASVVMRNSDSPHLPEKVVCQAFEALEARAGSVVLGPDLDGGYYLVGMTGAARIFPAQMSTDTVFEQTIAIAQGAGLAVTTLEEHLDVDTPEDLATFWLEFGNRADVRGWATWKELDEHPAWERFGELTL